MRMAIPSKFTTGGSGTRNPATGWRYVFWSNPPQLKSRQDKNVHQVSKLSKSANSQVED